MENGGEKKYLILDNSLRGTDPEDDWHLGNGFPIIPDFEQRGFVANFIESREALGIGEDDQFEKVGLFELQS